MGACTISLTNQFPTGGPMRLVTGSITMSNSYATGGDTLPASAFGVLAVTLLLFDDNKGGILFDYDYTNGKMKAIYPVGGATASPTTVSAVPQVTSGASTASAVNATTPALTPGVGKEVGATADLSSLVMRFVAYGL